MNIQEMIGVFGKYVITLQRGSSSFVSQSMPWVSVNAPGAYLLFMIVVFSVTFLADKPAY